jgi:hypothetical protein
VAKLSFNASIDCLEIPFFVGDGFIFGARVMMTLISMLRRISRII